VDRLKETLSLTDEQAEKIRGINDEYRSAIRDYFRNARRNGMGPENARDDMQRARERLNEKVKDVLTDEQKPKFDAWIKDGGESRERGSREPTPEARIKLAMDALKIEDQEQEEKIRALVTEVVQAQTALRQFDTELRGKIEKLMADHGLSEASLSEKLKEMEDERQKLSAAVREVQSKLTEAVTIRMKASLMSAGIL
jgi:Spy/CpxP family protein refolding chaperone